MKKGFWFSFATIVALTFSGCGGGSSSATTTSDTTVSSGSTCEDFSGSWVYTVTYDYSACGQPTYVGVATANIAQTGCSIVVTYPNDASSRDTGTVTGSSGTATGSSSTSNYTYSVTKNGLTLNGSGSGTTTTFGASCNYSMLIAGAKI